MENVAIGEKLSTLGSFLSVSICVESNEAHLLLLLFPSSTLTGPDAYVHAATSFYRALRIYPAPAELMQSESTLPPSTPSKLRSCSLARVRREL